jgi:hypothetical protein
MSIVKQNITNQDTDDISRMLGDQGRKIGQAIQKRQLEDTTLDISAADHTLTDTEIQKHYLVVDDASGTKKIIAPAMLGMWFMVENQDAAAAALVVSDASGDSAVAVPPSSIAMVRYDGTHYIITSLFRHGGGTFYKPVEPIIEVSLTAGDCTLTVSQSSAGTIVVTEGHATNAIIAPDVAGLVYEVVNKDATLAANIKKASGTAVTIAAGKRATVKHTGTEYERSTADV